MRPAGGTEGAGSEGPVASTPGRSGAPSTLCPCHPFEPRERGVGEARYKRGRRAQKDIDLGPVLVLFAAEKEKTEDRLVLRTCIVAGRCCSQSVWPGLPGRPRVREKSLGALCWGGRRGISSLGRAVQEATKVKTSWRTYHKSYVELLRKSGKGWTIRHY